MKANSIIKRLNGSQLMRKSHKRLFRTGLSILFFLSVSFLAAPNGFPNFSIIPNEKFTGMSHLFPEENGYFEVDNYFSEEERQKAIEKLRNLELPAVRTFAPAPNRISLALSNQPKTFFAGNTPQYAIIR